MSVKMRKKMSVKMRKNEGLMYDRRRKKVWVSGKAISSSFFLNMLIFTLANT